MAVSVTRFSCAWNSRSRHALMLKKSLDFNRMTHLNLAFVNPPLCAGSCTVASDLTLAANRSLTDDALKAIVGAAHANGTKVLISIGGAGGDRNIMQFYNAGLSAELTTAPQAHPIQFGRRFARRQPAVLSPGGQVGRRLLRAFEYVAIERLPFHEEPRIPPRLQFRGMRSMVRA